MNPNINYGAKYLRMQCFLLGRDASGRSKSASILLRSAITALDKLLYNSMKLEDLQPTEVFSTYWWFASERYVMSERRLVGHPPPWTSDPDLQKHRFTNVF